MDVKNWLDENNVPMNGEQVDVGAWAKTLGYEVVGNELRRSNSEERAVSVSPGYGAGWSTWNELSPLDPVANLIFLTMGDDKDGELFHSIYCFVTGRDSDEYLCTLGAKNVYIEWIGVNRKFKVVEYDGSESIEYANGGGWL